MIEHTNNSESTLHEEDTSLQNLNKIVIEGINKCTVINLLTIRLYEKETDPKYDDCITNILKKLAITGNYLKFYDPEYTAKQLEWAVNYIMHDEKINKKIIIPFNYEAICNFYELKYKNASIIDNIGIATSIIR